MASSFLVMVTNPADTLLQEYAQCADPDRAECLLEADRETTDPYDREHVTPFVYRQPERYRLANLVCPFGNYSHVNLSVDTADDYERALSVHRRLPESYDYRDILTVIELEGL